MFQGSRESTNPSQAMSDEAVMAALNQARLTLDNTIEGIRSGNLSLERLQGLSGRLRAVDNSGCNNTSCGGGGGGSGCFAS